MQYEQKVWGRCAHLFDGQVAVSLLETIAGTCCSIHWHRDRFNKFIVISGAIDVVEYLIDEPGQPVEEWRTRLGPNESIDIPPGLAHRFEVIEPGRIVEVYWAEPPGSPVSLDDIVRIEEGKVL